MNQTKIDKMRELITESLRVQLGGDLIDYINVGHALQDACARQNHTIFARRGCGKTLLLHDSGRKLKPDLRAIYLNCEDFKRHTFPNVLIEILSALFREIEANLPGWFGRKKELRDGIQKVIKRLASMQHSPDTKTENVRQTASVEVEAASSGGVGAKARNFAAFLGFSNARRARDETEKVFAQHREKLQELDLWLPELKKSLRDFFALSNNVKGIFLQIDDLYHLRRADHLRKMEGRFSEIDVSESGAKDKMRSAPVLDADKLEKLALQTPSDPEAALKAEIAEELSSESK